MDATDLDRVVKRTELRRLPKTPARVVFETAWQIIDMVPALVKTPPCDIAEVAVRPLQYRGVPIAGQYESWLERVTVNSLEVAPLASYFEARDAGTLKALPDSVTAEAREAVCTLLHEVLHSCGPPGGAAVEALTELLTERYIDAVLNRLGMSDLASAPPVLRGGYPGESAFLAELIAHAARRTSVPEAEILSKLQYSLSGQELMKDLCDMIGATSPEYRRRVKQSFEQLDKAGWDIVRKRNALPRSEWNGMMAPLVPAGRQAGRDLVASL